MAMLEKPVFPAAPRISKSDIRVEAYGTIDELISSMGLARALCKDAAIQTLTESIQRELFKVGSSLFDDTGKPQASIAHRRRMR